MYFYFLPGSSFIIQHSSFRLPGIGFRPSRFPAFVPWRHNPVIIFFHLKTRIVVIDPGAGFLIGMAPVNMNNNKQKSCQPGEKL